MTNAKTKPKGKLPSNKAKSRTQAKSAVVDIEQPDWKITFERHNLFSEAFKGLAATLRKVTRR